jgi:zinc protease
MEVKTVFIDRYFFGRPASATKTIGGLGLAVLGLLAAGGAIGAPAIQSWTTDDGAEVLFVPADDLPIVDVRVVFDAGSARDGAQSGLASITAGMLTEGAGGLSADEIAERVESVGVELGSGAERDMAWVSIRSLTDPETLEVAVDTLTRVLSQPELDADELERVRENRLVALRLAEQNPGTVGKRAVYQAMFGDHPYAADPSGTLESVAALSRDDLVAFHQRFYSAPNATVAIVGDLDRAGAEALASRITAGLPAGGAAPELPPVPDLEQPVVEQIAFPSSQSHVYMGQPGMARGDPDYFPLYVGNHILGGSGLVSLLMEEVREKRGLSYSTYSYFLPMARRGPLLMGLQTKTTQRDEARAVMTDTLARFIEQGPSDQELSAAVKNITGGFPLRIASNAKVVQYLAMIGFYDLPLDYLDRFNERVSAVTIEQIRDAFQRRVHPQRLAVVMVGRADTADAADADAGAGSAVSAEVPASSEVAPSQSAARGGGEG